MIEPRSPGPLANTLTPRPMSGIQVLLFNTNYPIQQYSFICTQSNGFKYCNVIPIFQCKHTSKELKNFYLTLMILFKITHSFAQLFQVLLCIKNNSIKHQSFFYTQLNDQTVLFLTIQFSICQQS